MERNEKVRLLEKLVTKSTDITVRDRDDPKFRAWKNLVERTLIQIFGANSTEIEQFNELEFFYRSGYFISGTDYSLEHSRVFEQDYEIIITSIKEYIEEFKEEEEIQPIVKVVSSALSRVFISHASKDSEIVEEVIEALEAIGLPSDKIFCTSFEGHGIDLGSNFLDAIKDELSSESLVLFILTENFYNSPVCMCEMGATWVLSKEHIPIVVPPLNFSDIRGVIPQTQGFKINEPLKWNSLKEKVEKMFSISDKQSLSAWERKRNRIVERIESKLQQGS